MQIRRWLLETCPRSNRNHRVTLPAHLAGRGTSDPHPTPLEHLLGLQTAAMALMIGMLVLVVMLRSTEPRVVHAMVLSMVIGDLPHWEDGLRRKTCSGYPVPGALRFLDQTTTVATKGQAQKAARTPPLISMPTSIQDRAMSHIFQYHVGDRQIQGVLFYLADFLRTDPSDALHDTVKSVGLACISRIYNLPALKQLAGEEYGKVLRATNKDLQDPVTAISDSTMGTVIALSLLSPAMNHK
ncbi:hypothetical protein N7512_002696 [Penicillium capsulatum]|nr:hypothetical protein N7512_002696 [Penicillium capsulatum]